MSQNGQKLIPDTLMLEDRARHVLNAIISIADDDHEGIPFFSANLMEKPAFMRHGDWDYGSSHGRMVDALVLARHMTGATDGLDVEERYRSNLLSFFKDDGLSYRQNNPKTNWEPNANMIDQRAVILALTSWYMSTGDRKVKEAADKHVAALKRIAVKERDVWYYPNSEYKYGGWPSANAVQLRLAPDPAAFCGRLVMPLLKYHELTGNGDALELCEFFSAMIVRRSGVFNPDGSFNDALAYRSGHFHTRIGTLDALARFGYYTHDASLIHFVKKSYDWALTWCTSFGWTPGDMHEQAYEHETCSLVDLIATGITLARSGYTEYWSVVERFLRNHLTESQLLDLSWVEDLDDKSQDDVGLKTYYRVAERTRGAFAGYSAPNDFCCDLPHGRGHTSDLQTCCIGSGTRGLFMGWSNTVTEENGTVSVNFLLNRGSQWLDVHSHLPHEGKVVLDVRKPLKRLLVRIPEWAGYAKVEVRRERGDAVRHQSGGEPSMWVKDRFLVLGEASEGERITVTFPLSHRQTVEKAMGQEFITKWRGDDVIHLSPEGVYHPFYNNRKVFDTAPMRAGDYRRLEREFYW
ncbi:glycoside hydrolase family 127 protein [Paenibacillus hamazuiensis]|uniref:glycoside hydrolase family 127 protein n=1 Tax=Paenibacillus hamazuiensis TaxID=2936508 RepID=UPI00200F1914|nr:glycoside hydrolase family 127 protein [Paenibacillus hamazuiensis]